MDGMTQAVVVDSIHWLASNLGLCETPAASSLRMQRHCLTSAAERMVRRKRLQLLVPALKVMLVVNTIKTEPLIIGDVLTLRICAHKPLKHRGTICDYRLCS